MISDDDWWPPGVLANVISDRRNPGLGWRLESAATLLLLEPLLHAAGDVGDVFEAVLEHPFAGAGAAHTGGAVDEVFDVFGEVGGDGGPATQGKKLAALDVGHEVFVLFANIQENAVKAVGEDLAKLEGGDFRERSHGAVLVR